MNRAEAAPFLPGESVGGHTLDLIGQIQQDVGRIVAPRSAKRAEIAGTGYKGQNRILAVIGQRYPPRIHLSSGAELFRQARCRNATEQLLDLRLLLRGQATVLVG